jgi:CBS domain-containing protein
MNRDATPQTEAPVRARDVMTAQVVATAPETPVQDVARLLLEHRISAVPVVNADGVPIGMVSEGDLIGRERQDRLAGREWWLALVTGRQPFDDAFRERLEARDRTAADVMAAPLVTVTEDADLEAVARLLAIHRIKRVPVVRDGRLVGIVSRADLLRALAAGLPHAAAADKPKPRGFLQSLFGEYRRPHWEIVPVHGSEPAAPPPESTRIAAADFRHLVADFHKGEARHRDAQRRAAAQQRRQRARDLIDLHVFDDAWRQMLHNARTAAENGATEHMLLRFPSPLCIDGGRAINVAEHDWPATLRGEPAEIYLRWERELKPQGFALSARVLEFPDGKPGDIGLFLAWGE